MLSYHVYNFILSLLIYIYDMGYSVHQIIIHLFRSINNVSSSDLALLHQVEYFLQLAQANDLVGGLDESSAEELDRLGCVLSVSDVAALDVDHAVSFISKSCSILLHI